MLTGFDMSAAWGEDENSFELRCGIGEAPRPGQYVAVIGTEIGGRVTSVEPSVSRGGARSAVCEGRTWHGMLAAKVLMPPEGRDRPSYEGTAGGMLAWIVEQAGLGSVMRAGPSDAPVSFEFGRFEDCYSAARSALGAHGLRLGVKAAERRVVLSAERSRVVSGLDVTPRLESGCVNHLVCAGEGQNQERAVVHLYADSDGRVSGAQTLFGPDEVAELYDYSSADVETLTEKGTERLKKAQKLGSVDVEARGGVDAYVGDVLTGRDEWLGVEVSATVAKKIAKVERGMLYESCEAG